jgi:CubicO group peptidase (beta-lactamase class C family)
MKERIFDPLGMRDTGFSVDDERALRLPVAYQFNHANQAHDVFDDVAGSAWRGQPPHESGGGGLVTTIGDYQAFLRMLLDRGRAGKEQLLSRATVELMTMDHLTDEQRVGGEAILGRHAGWGFGMAVDVRREQIFQNVGRFGWNGGLGTTAYVDPKEGMIGMLFTQRLMDSPDPPRVMVDFWTGAYAAME